MLQEFLLYEEQKIEVYVDGKANQGELPGKLKSCPFL
jgi:hypothetical protein